MGARARALSSVLRIELRPVECAERGPVQVRLRQAQPAHVAEGGEGVANAVERLRVLVVAVRAADGRQRLR
eukprot:4800099-Pleurochrysis_carterae.AAC.1